MLPDAYRSRSVILAALLGLATLLVVIPWFHAPLSFDEAYNLQVVRNLVHGHGYATDGALDGGHLVPFDYRITTGPTVLLPVAAVTAVLGDHVWVYRLVPALFSCALVATWCVIVRRRWGVVAGVLAGAAVLTIDNAAFLHVQRFGPGSVMGENASVLFLVLAVAMLGRPWACGLLVGLAVMTKVVAVLAVPAVMLGLLRSAHRGRRSAGGAVGIFVAVALAPALIWQLYRLLAVGPSRAWVADRAFVHFLASTGGSTSATVSLPERVLSQLSMLGIVGVTALLLALSALMVAWRREGVQGWRSWPIDLTTLALAGLTLEVWWLVLEGQGWVRHSTQATLLLVPLLAAATARLLRHHPRTAWRDVLAVALPLLVVTQVGVAAYHGFRPPGPSLEDQRLVAEQVASRTHVFLIPSTPQDFELLLLAPVTPRPLDGRGGVLVLSGAHGRQPATGCDRILYERAGYVVCRVDPTR